MQASSSCHLREAFGYECTNPDFPKTPFLFAKNNFLATEHSEVLFDNEVVQLPPPHPPAQETAVEAATTAGENMSINQALCESIPNSNPSLNNNILIALCTM